MTTDNKKDIIKIENWLKKVNIDVSKAQDLIDKYGLENTMKLVQEALMAPHPIAKHLDGVTRTSQKTINYFLENDITAEEISAITKTDLTTVTNTLPKEEVVEPVERPEVPLATIGETALNTNEFSTSAEQTQDGTTLTPEDERAQIHADLIDQAQASMNTALDEDKRNPLAAEYDSRFDESRRLKISTQETETPVDVNTPITVSSEDEPLTEEEYIRNMVKRQLSYTPISPDLPEEEMKEALLQQYAQLRQERYNALCYNSGLDMYTASMAISDIHGRKAMNRHIWNGCDDIDFSIVPADSTARVVPNLITDQKTLNSLHNMECASCAITGATIVYDVCQKMDFSNNATFTPPSEKGHQYRSAAGHISSMDSETNGYRGNGKMKDLILKGKIGPGDRISTPSGTESGYHLRTVIAVNRDDKGEITGYVVQGNNNLELSYHDINDTKDPFNNRTVTYSSTSQWASDQIDAEIAQMKDLSIEEIQALIAKEREAVSSVIIDTVRNKESQLAQYNRGDIQLYKDNHPILYNPQTAFMPHIDTSTLVAPTETILSQTFTESLIPINNPFSPECRMELKGELTSMTGTEIVSAETFFRSRDFERRLDARQQDDPVTSEPARTPSRKRTPIRDWISRERA